MLLTCDRLDLESIGSQLLEPNNFHGHCTLPPWTLKVVLQSLSSPLSFTSWFGLLVIPFNMMPCRRHLTLPLFGLNVKDFGPIYTSRLIELLHFVRPIKNAPKLWTMYFRASGGLRGDTRRNHFGTPSSGPSNHEGRRPRLRA